MTSDHDRKNATKRAEDTTNPAADAAPKPKPPGHVEFDSRGNSVWHWDAEQGDSTSKLLKSLQVEDLELEPTRSVRAQGKSGHRPGANPSKESREPRRSGRDAADDVPGRGDAGGGFDPYNRS
jgi:hypothetical protein